MPYTPSRNPVAPAPAPTTPVSEAPRNERARDKALAVLDTRAPTTFTCAIASDSTGDGTQEWYELALQAAFAALWPERPAQVIRWNKANGAYIDPIIWQSAETPAVPATGDSTTPNALIGQDGFNTAEATELSGRAPDIGAGLWASTTGAFKTISGYLFYTAVTGSGFNCYFNLNPRTGTDIAISGSFRVSTITPSSNRTIKLYGPYLTTTNNITLNIVRGVNAGTPATVSLVKIIGGTSTTLATFPAGTLPDQEIVDKDFTISLAGTTVMATIGDASVIAELAPTDLTALTATNTRAGFSASNDPDFRFGPFSVRGTVAVPGSAGSPALPSPLPVATIYNPSAAGEAASYQSARLAKMYPVRPDLMVFSHGHNYTSSPADYLTAVQEFFDGFHAVYPGVPIVIVSQNPEFGASAPAHAARQLALRDFANEKGWDYAGIFEAYSKRPDGGKSLVNADNIHPILSGHIVGQGVFQRWLAQHSARNA